MKCKNCSKKCKNPNIEKFVVTADGKKYPAIRHYESREDGVCFNCGCTNPEPSDKL